MNRKRNILIIAIILMAVGFAVVTTNLMINGNVEIANNESDYDIIFTKSTLEGVENNSLIGSNGKRISYETKKLTKAGDTSELIYEITNNSSQYDGEVSINCTVKGTTTHKDLYAIDTTNTPKIIKAKTSEVGSIKISLIKETTEEIREEFECELNITAMERTRIGGTIYKEELLNGTDPVVSGDLIPVTLANDGTVVYADTSEEWYNYENKEWANAVILVDSPSKRYRINDVIEESDIESYFVWIPRYRYQLFHTNSPYGTSTKLSQSNAKTIEIEFESKEEEVKTGSKDGEWLTHLAFTNFDVNGLWVGKFETGYKGATTTEAAEQNNANSENIIIKPNVYSWRSNPVNNFFKAMYNYKRELNSHMMKNTEWGAVVYLSHSKYGINEEIRINNNSNYLTGYAANEKDAAGSTTNNQTYNTEVGYLASTTGNITGVYDLSGGAGEFVAATLNNTVGASELTTTEINVTYKGYFDVYPNDSKIRSYNNRILGDATGELGPFYDDGSYIRNNWYLDFAHFIYSTYPWFTRGGSGSSSSNSGELTFFVNNGAGNQTAARLVLTT